MRISHLFLTLFPFALAHQTTANPALTVYLECHHETDATKPKSLGSGVLVSAEGHILTPRHVVPEGYVCLGAIENKTNPKRALIRPAMDRALVDNIDGKLLQMVPNTGEVFEYAAYCKIGQEHLGTRIDTLGFHQTSVAGPSITTGVLSTVVANDLGIVETDAMSVSGKSGGPIFISGTNNIIGIVAGASFTPLGLPAFYGALEAGAVASAFVIMQESEDCQGPHPAAYSDVLIAGAMIDGVIDIDPDFPADRPPADIVSYLQSHFPRLDGRSVIEREVYDTWIMTVDDRGRLKVGFGTEASNSESSFDRDYYLARFDGFDTVEDVLQRLFELEQQRMVIQRPINQNNDIFMRDATAMEKLRASGVYGVNVQVPGHEFSYTLCEYNSSNGILECLDTNNELVRMERGVRLEYPLRAQFVDSQANQMTLAICTASAQSPDRAGAFALKIYEEIQSSGLDINMISSCPEDFGALLTNAKSEFGHRVPDYFVDLR